MAFKPNYGRDRADRERAARARSEEKQRKKRTRKLRCAKPRAPQPNPHRMKSKANGERYRTEKRDWNRKKSSLRANWKGFSQDYAETALAAAEQCLRFVILEVVPFFHGLPPRVCGR